MSFTNLPDSFSSNPSPFPPEALHLLRSLDYGTLGDGNAVAGMNVLTSMCVTLAAVAGPQAAIVSGKGESYRVGINLLTAGSLSGEQVASRVLDPLRTLQNNLSQNTMQAAAKSNHHLAKKLETTVGPPKSPITPEHLASAKDSMLLDALRPSEFHGESFYGGRPNSGGPQLKFKFVESASFVVIARNPQRSVTLGLYPAGGDTPVPAGNVTIPPNHEVPAPGEVIDAKYLYAFRESGAVYQPVYLGKRDDIPATECGVEQLKYKPEPVS